MGQQERIYKVFVSSTFKDLRNVREKIVRELNVKGHVPRGMEFFPGTPGDPLSQIREEIDESDFYILIVGERYGQIPDGEELSYTELEYDYACSKDKPVLFIRYVGRVPKDAMEGEDPDKKKKLILFRKRVPKKFSPRYCQSITDVVSCTHNDLDLLIRDYGHKGMGWVRCSEENLPGETPEAILKDCPFLAKTSEIAVPTKDPSNQRVTVVSNTQLSYGEVFYAVASAIDNNVVLRRQDMKEVLFKIVARHGDRLPGFPKGHYPTSIHDDSKQVASLLASGLVELSEHDRAFLHLTEKGQLVYAAMRTSRADS